MFQSITLDAFVAAAASLFAGFMMVRPLHRALAFGAAAFFGVLALTHSVPIALGVGALCAYGVFYPDQPITPSVAPRASSPEPATSPAYWTLTEAVSWIAFGEAVQTKDWAAMIRRRNATPAEEKHRADVAEHMLLEKLRDPTSGIDIQGKEEGDKVHKLIPPNVFLSDVGFNIFDSTVGRPNRADLGAILFWKGPEWKEVRIRQSHVRECWSGDIGQQTVPMLDAAKKSYARSRNTLVGEISEVTFGDEEWKKGTLTWHCTALSDRITMYGNWPPSDTPERIPWLKLRNQLTFRMVDGKLVLQQYSPRRGYENLYVLAKDLPTAIERVYAMGQSQTLVNGLAEFIFSAQPIMDDLQDHDAMPPTKAITTWNSEVEMFLRKELGAAAEAKFTEPRQFSDDELGPLGRNPVNTLRVGMQHKIGLLYKFIDEAGKQ